MLTWKKSDKHIDIKIKMVISVFYRGHLFKFNKKYFSFLIKSEIL